MSNEIPPQIQNQIAQLQQLQLQMQSIGRQKMQLEVMIRETDNALQELNRLDENSIIYRSVGEIMIRSDKEKVKEDLTEKKETYDIRLKTLERQEERIQKRYQQLQQQIRQSLGGGSGSET